MPNRRMPTQFRTLLRADSRRIHRRTEMFRQQNHARNRVHSHEGPLVLNNVLLSAGIALGAAVAVATPASADPNSFGTLGCICSTQPGDIPQGGLAVKDQVNQGIRNGLGSLHSDPPSPGGF
jgi:hypothetical protein